jgi:hypothetical protein
MMTYHILIRMILLCAFGKFAGFVKSIAAYHPEAAVATRPQDDMPVFFQDVAGFPQALGKSVCLLLLS